MEKDVCIGEDYEFLGVIGKGGMSEVYLAKDRRTQRLYAIKVIRKEGEGALAAKNIMEMAETLKGLSHPSLPKIYDISDEKDAVCLVMEYVRGRTLYGIVKKDGPCAKETASDWAKQLCDVLGFLHSQDPPLIYRDLKPSNVILQPNGRLKLIDMDMMQTGKQDGSYDGVLLGTPGYASPEQFGLRQTDIRTDIYSFGMTIRFLLTGKDPDTDETDDLFAGRGDRCFYEGMCAIIKKCTALYPDDRYPDCDSLAYALKHPRYGTIRFQKRQQRKLRLFMRVSKAAILCGLLSGLLVFSHRISDLGAALFSWYPILSGLSGILALLAIFLFFSLRILKAAALRNGAENIC